MIRRRDEIRQKHQDEEERIKKEQTILIKKIEKEREEKVERLVRERETGYEYDHSEEPFRDKAMSG